MLMSVTGLINHTGQILASRVMANVNVRVLVNVNGHVLVNVNGVSGDGLPAASNMDVMTTGDGTPRPGYGAGCRAVYTVIPGPCIPGPCIRARSPDPGPCPPAAASCR